jgi:hypothetical protein
MFGDGTGQRVFDGDDGAVDGASLHAVEDFERTGTGYDGRARRRRAFEHGFRRFVTEGTEFSLDGNLHGLLPYVVSA